MQDRKWRTRSDTSPVLHFPARHLVLQIPVLHIPVLHFSAAHADGFTFAFCSEFTPRPRPPLSALHGRLTVLTIGDGMHESGARYTGTGASCIVRVSV